MKILLESDIIQNEIRIFYVHPQDHSYKIFSMIVCKYEKCDYNFGENL